MLLSTLITNSCKINKYSSNSDEKDQFILIIPPKMSKDPEVVLKFDFISTRYIKLYYLI